jgi:hypothetical protein
MKKVLLFSFLILSSGLVAQRTCKLSKHKESFLSTLSAGYVFKSGSDFRKVYGPGMIDAITADWCYSGCGRWGGGAKVSYWRAKGRTTFLKQHSLLQEVPVTFYVRRLKNFDCGLQLNGSLGGGFAWIQEKSYLGKIRAYKGIGELEVGLNYPIWRCIKVVGALRYLFPPQSIAGKIADVGGVDLRAGIGFAF